MLVSLAESFTEMGNEKGAKVKEFLNLLEENAFTLAIFP